jgi:MOSC domain-containing protein YiiM
VDARIVRISISPGGVPKRAIPSAWVTTEGLVGDAHRHRHHGGQERAVCLYSIEVIEWLRIEGHSIARVLVEGPIRRDDPVRLLDAVQAAELSAAAPR